MTTRKVLVASRDERSAGTLASMLRELSRDVLWCSTLVQAEEMIARDAVSLVFCDESLDDGCFRDLLTARRKGGKPRVVITMRTGEWREYLEAMRLGAFDVVRCPARQSDIECVVARAMEEERGPGRATV